MLRFVGVSVAVLYGRSCMCLAHRVLSHLPSLRTSTPALCYAVVSMNHLDGERPDICVVSPLGCRLLSSSHMRFCSLLAVGYNGIPVTGLINNVLNEYFTIYFPRAVAMAAAMRALNYTDRFVYTTHSWLVDLYLHCPTNFTLSGVQLICPSVGDVLSFKAAVAAGDITFHAAPFNIQYGGALSQTMLDAIFAQPARVASELGVPAPRVASLRDVPGAPRSIIPALVKAGIPALTIGVNNYAPSPRLCPAPAPANGPCIWQEPSTKDSILVMLTDQNIGYPLNPVSKLRAR